MAANNDNLSDVLLVESPKNNSKLHYILNDTNHTSSILLFNQNLNLPAIPPNTDYVYFLCFELFFQNYSEETLTNEKELKCYNSIPNYPFNITNLVNGIYYIKTSLLLVSKSIAKSKSKSDRNTIGVVKKELTVFYVKEMINFHANYVWSKIEAYHSILNGLDVKMDIFGNSSNNTNVKLVKIPSEWIVQLFISSSYRLLWLLVSKSTALSSIKYEISKHTGIDVGCIDIRQNGKILHDYDTIESVDWFYNKYNTFIGLDPSLFCKPIECGFGYLNKLNISDECSYCDYRTIQYKTFYAQNKGKMWRDLTNSIDSRLTLPVNS